MYTKVRFFLVLALVSTLIMSCGGAATVAPAATEAPATQPPEAAATEAPAAATEPPVATEAPPTEAPTEAPAPTEIAIGSNCSVTPDGVGQSYIGHESATAILGSPHGTYVYNDVINQIKDSKEFMDPPITLSEQFEGGISLSPAPTAPSAEDKQITDLVVIMVVDTFVNENDEAGKVDFIKRVDLYVNNTDPAKGLIVVAVDTDGLKVDSMVKNIPMTIDLFTNNEIQIQDYFLSPTRRFVVNMSFVLVPCNPDPILQENIKDILRDQGLDKAFDNFEERPLEDFTVEKLGEKYDSEDSFRSQIKENIPAIREISSRLSTYELSDKYDSAVFHAFIVHLVYDPRNSRNWEYSPNQDNTCQPGQDGFYNILCDYFYNKELEIVYVGAAGNFGYDYPLAPASWDFVDSISSTPSSGEPNPHAVHGLLLAEYSNSGEIQDNGLFPDPGNNIKGTSFAAPKFSYKIAHYLLVEDGQSPCKKSSPALGYATNKDPVFTNASATPLPDNNLTFNDAMTKYCP